jgi:radical SAM family uncharacterized protein/radical SAM-linked protein
VAESTSHPYQDFIHRVEKPARYLGGEYQSVTKDWTGLTSRICLAFPDLYDIGMSHLGTKILYSLLNGHEDIACERAFAPWVDMERELRERELPILSLESARPLNEFDVVGFSLQYEMTYTNVLNILDLSNIPLRAEARSESDPLIIAGGPTVTHPEPVAPFFDAMLVGDAEAILPESLRLIGSMKAEGRSRTDILRALAGLGGWYCPALYELRLEERNDMLVVDPETSEGPYPIVRAHVENISDYPFPTDTPIPAAEAIFDRVSIEIARGCTEGCRFCQAGMIYRPVRERDPEEIVDAVMAAMENGGYDEVSLTSLSTADYSCISPLIKKVMARIRERRASLSVSSLRAYGLSEDLLDEIASVKATGLTFAPEAGTQRMRDVVNKNVTEEDILTSADRIFARGWKRMKLYFMIGLPTEEDADVRGIIETASKIRRVGLDHKVRHVEVTASASSHVPKPHTPFQWAAMDSMEEISRKQTILREFGKKRSIDVKLHDARISYLEGIVARGDRRVADLIEAAWKNGCRFDGWGEHLNFDAWLEAIDQVGLEPERYLGTLPVDGTLPWDHIDVGLAENFLFKEWKRATKNRLSPPCGKPLGAQVHHTNLEDAHADESKLVCYHCGVACDLSGMRSERIDFLKRLGAERPSEARSEDDLPDWQRVRINKKGQRLPPLRADQGPSVTYRLLYTKLGTTAMTSQLDLARMVPRALRRSGIRLKYSVGFSPKPTITFGPALPLGVSSFGEVVDFAALDDLSPDLLLERLSQVAEEGAIPIGIVKLPDDAKSCARVAKLAEYTVAAPGSWSAEDLELAKELALGEAPVNVTVTRKKGERVIDVRDGLVHMEVIESEPLMETLLGLPTGTPALRWRVNLDEGPHVRAEDMIRGLIPSTERPNGLVLVRTGLWGLQKGEMFSLLAPGAAEPFAPHQALEMPRPGQ